MDTIDTGNIEKIHSRINSLIEIMDTDEYMLSINTIGDQAVNICFPGDNDCCSYEIEDFLLYTDSFDDIIKANNSTIRNRIYSQTIINLPIDTYSWWNKYNDLFANELYEAQIIEEPFLIGFYNTKEGLYDSDYWGACYPYCAIEFKYKYPDKILPIEEEIMEIKKILFFLCMKYKCAVTIGSLPIKEEFLNSEEENEIVTEKYLDVISTSRLPHYTPMLELYIDALKTDDNQLRFLLFYKIIEYISPSIAKKQSYEMLNKKLDLVPFQDRSYSYLDSIFELTRKFDISLKDSELSITVINECVDIIELSTVIPAMIKKQIAKKSQIPNADWSYSSIADEKIIEIKRILGSILYATRNSIVHAKSNYTKTGLECKEDDFEDLNKLMEKLCYSIIIWNNRQTEANRI